jgi:hypothetical protein
MLMTEEVLQLAKAVDRPPQFLRQWLVGLICLKTTKSLQGLFVDEPCDLGEFTSAPVMRSVLVI